MKCIILNDCNEVASLGLYKMFQRQECNKRKLVVAVYLLPTESETISRSKPQNKASKQLLDFPG